MHTAYRAYFRQRLEQMLAEDQLRAQQEARPGPYLDASQIARAALEEARLAMPPQTHLRADAEMLLYLLATEFVAKPVLAMEPQNAVYVAGIVAADTAELVASASAAAAAAGSPSGEHGKVAEISAHGVVEAASKNWSKLRSADLRIWDRWSAEPPQAGGPPEPLRFGP